MRKCNYDCENCDVINCDNEDYDIPLTIEEYSQAREIDKSVLELRRNVPIEEMSHKYIHNRANKEDYVRERNRQYERKRYKEQREKRLEAKKKQYQRHREEKLEYQREYYENNKEERKLKSRQYYIQHREEIRRKQNERYAQTHPKKPKLTEEEKRERRRAYRLKNREEINRKKREAYHRKKEEQKNG